MFETENEIRSAKLELANLYLLIKIQKQSDVTNK